LISRARVCRFWKGGDLVGRFLLHVMPVGSGGVPTMLLAKLGHIFEVTGLAGAPRGAHSMRGAASLSPSRQPVAESPTDLSLFRNPFLASGKRRLSLEDRRLTLCRADQQ
jgi:hypothetical protein